MSPVKGGLSLVGDGKLTLQIDRGAGNIWYPDCLASQACRVPGPGSFGALVRSPPQMLLCWVNPIIYQGPVDDDGY